MNSCRRSAAAEVPKGRPCRRSAAAEVSNAGTPQGAAPPLSAGRTTRSGYCVFPETVRCARRFCCQHASLDSMQTGTSLPYDTVRSLSAGTPRETR